MATAFFRVFRIAINGERIIRVKGEPVCDERGVHRSSAAIFGFQTNHRQPRVHYVVDRYYKMMSLDRLHNLACLAKYIDLTWLVAVDLVDPKSRDSVAI